jgi:hypothetical protein
VDGIGAVVVLKVDYPTHSHAQGLMAIVYEINESTGGILVCCEHGVVTHDGSRKDYWVPYDKYDVKARAQDTSPIEEALQSVRNLVLEGGGWFTIIIQRELSRDFIKRYS